MKIYMVSLLHRATINKKERLEERWRWCYLLQVLSLQSQ